MALALWSETHSGKYRRTRLFVMTLGYSRKSVRLIVCRSSSQAWAELRERAFRRPTGVTRAVVLDNLREGVLAPDIRTSALRRRPSRFFAQRGTGRPISIRFTAQR
jgi:transposase